MPTVYSYKVGEWRKKTDKEINDMKLKLEKFICNHILCDNGQINEILLSLESLEHRLKELTEQTMVEPSGMSKE